MLNVKSLNIIVKAGKIGTVGLEPTVHKADVYETSGLTNYPYVPLN